VADDRVVRPTSIRIADGGGQSARELVLEAGTGVTFATELVDGRLVVTFSAAGGSGTPATSVESETSFGVAAAVGSSTNYARQDHTHGSPAAPTAASVGADPAGTSAAGIAAHVAAGDPHPAYALEAALGSAAALNAATTRAASGLLQLDAIGLLGLDAILADARWNVARLVMANNAQYQFGMATVSPVGASKTPTTKAYTSREASANAGFFQGTRIVDTAVGFAVAIAFKVPVTTASRRIWCGLISTSQSDSDTASGHFVGIRYSTPAADAGWTVVSRDGTTQTVGTVGAAPVADVPYLLMLVKLPGSSSVSLVLSRLDTSVAVLTATVSATLPASGTAIDIGLWSWGQGVLSAIEISHATRAIQVS
jgi:hypothetical protein